MCYTSAYIISLPLMRFHCKQAIHIYIFYPILYYHDLLNKLHVKLNIILVIDNKYVFCIYMNYFHAKIQLQIYNIFYLRLTLEYCIIFWQEQV